MIVARLSLSADSRDCSASSCCLALGLGGLQLGEAGRRLGAGVGRFALLGGDRVARLLQLRRIAAIRSTAAFASSRRPLTRSATASS